MGTISFSNIEEISVGGNNKCCLATLTGSTSYATGGDSIDLSTIPFSTIDSINFSGVSSTADYILNFIPSTQLIKWLTLSGTISGGTVGNTTATNGTSAVTGTGTFLGTSPVSDLNLATPAFSGTGLTAAGQVITTTDNQTMTLNQCAGMWLLSATGATPPNLILSNTAVAGAPAVLTVQGAASTDAGAYRIVKALTPVGSVTALSGTAAAQIQNAHAHSLTGLSGSSTLAEVTATTNLSATTDRVLIFGR